MDLMFLNSLEIDQYVIQVYNESPIEVRVKYLIHQTHEHWLHIGQTKGYNHELIIPISCTKKYLMNVNLLDMKLIVSQL